MIVNYLVCLMNVNSIYLALEAESCLATRFLGRTKKFAKSSVNIKQFSFYLKTKIIITIKPLSQLNGVGYLNITFLIFPIKPS